MADENGYRTGKEDINIPRTNQNQTMFMTPSVTQYKGRRADTYRTYLKSASHRKNLLVVKNARVLRAETENDILGYSQGFSDNKYLSHPQVWFS